MDKTLELFSYSLGTMKVIHFLEFSYSENKFLTSASLKEQNIDGSSSSTKSRGKTFTPEQILNFLQNGQLDAQKMVEAKIFEVKEETKDLELIQKMYLNNVCIGYRNKKRDDPLWGNFIVEIDYKSDKFCRING